MPTGFEPASALHNPLAGDRLNRSAIAPTDLATFKHNVEFFKLIFYVIHQLAPLLWVQVCIIGISNGKKRKKCVSTSKALTRKTRLML